MGYQALLFCPDEKTSRTVTQVLSELEFTVEHCGETFAAVKKLMGQHFDAVVVDCDNEQNATLLFKSARNSTSNQASLAVAVVEGQAGVAKAFRIGANLVLTKPINIEQAKGTLRVARGLLRKSEPGKPAAPATPSTPAIPTSVKPASPATTAVKATAIPTPTQDQPTRPLSAPAAKSPATSPWPAAPVASSAPAKQDDDPLDIDFEESSAKTPVTPVPSANAATVQPAPTSRLETLSNATAAKPAAAARTLFSTAGAASAPAPARTKSAPQTPDLPSEKPGVEDIFEKPAESAKEEAGVIGASPTFAFGGASGETTSSGGSKKILLGVAAAVIIGVMAYVGLSLYQGHADKAATPLTTSSLPAVKPQPVKPAAAAPSGAPSAPATSTSVNSTSAVSPSSGSASANIDSLSKETATHSASSSNKALNSAPSAPVNEDDAEDTKSAAPLVVKGGKVHESTKSSAPDTPAPSLIGMASPGTAPPPSLIASGNTSVKPVLQTVNISQGVSQGLLIKKISPSYPANALRMRIEGPVEIMATISKEGSITHIKVLSGDAQLTKAASDAVRQWKYKPYLLNGEPVEVQTQITINFKLPH